MVKLSDHQSARTTKLLLIGDTGTGKTGSLASLADAGYNIRLVDLDNGADVLKNILRGPKSPYKNAANALDRIEYETITDPMVQRGNKLVPRTAQVWSRTVKLLVNWETETAKFGPISTWTEQDVLVIDSLTMLSTAALNFVLSMNARLGQQPQQSDWYGGQQLIEGLMQMLYDASVKCNVIVMSHIAFIENEHGATHGYPSTLGKALSPKLGRYFNTVLMARTAGQGQGAKRRIFTSTVGTVELKNTSPLTVKPEYDLSTGLAEYFRDVREA